MFYGIRANGKWLRLECSDNVTAAEAMAAMSRGGQFIDSWCGREDKNEVDAIIDAVEHATGSLGKR